MATNILNMTAVINRKRYDAAKADVLADNHYWDGSNFERSGRNTYLLRGHGAGAYFAVHTTLWQGERDRIEPLTTEQAIDLWERLQEQHVAFEDAFPGAAITEA